MYPRSIKYSKNNSFFLFGARGTGKTTWLREAFPVSDEVIWFDLLNPLVEDRLRRDPAVLTREIAARGDRLRWVVVDEVQKLPKLLDQVHASIESGGPQFVLTGSSARKLKRAQANLLAGRAFVNQLHPLTAAELGDDFRLETVLRWGSLPRALALSDETDRVEFLRAYALTYVREEIQIEQLVRRVDPFRDFLEIAAVNSGRVINASRIAREAGVDHKSVQNYYDILESTWLGFRLPAYHRSIRKSQRLSPKFYLFDLGVKHALARSLDAAPAPGTSYFGECFEHWVVQELHRRNLYARRDFRLTYFATHAGGEIDVVIDRGRGRRPWAIEIKSAERVDAIEARRLEALAKDLDAERILYLSRDPVAQRLGAVECLPWREGVESLFGE